MKKICFNPVCQREFTPSHYGDRQLVCDGEYTVKCRKCSGDDCKKCGGKGAFKQFCRLWYKAYWTRMRKRPRGIPDDDLKKILSSVRELPFWSSLFTVAAWSALRKGELLGVSWSDVLKDSIGIRANFELRGQWSDTEGFKEMKVGEGKNGYLLLPARNSLLAFLPSQRKDPEFPRARIWETTEANAWKRFVSVQRRLGIKNPDTGREYRFHDLRHTGILKTYHATGDLNQARELAGHKSLATTTIYSTERPDEYVAKLDAKFRKPRRGDGR